MVIRVTAQGTTRVHRITAPGTTVVKTITIGTPSITGTASVGTLSGLDDVSTANRSDGTLISWDSSASTHVYTGLDASVRQLISVQDLGGDGALSYIEATGVIAYSGPTPSEVRAHFSATNSITYDSSTGVFDFNFDSAINNVKTHIVPISNENIDLGDSNYKFRDLWLKGTTIHLGSITVNDSIGTFTAKDSNGDIAPLNLRANTTADLDEGSNLYYTDARVRSSITVNTDSTGQISYDSSTGTFTFTDSNFARTDIQDVFHEGLTIPDTKKIVFSDNVADIFETGGNFFMRRTNTDVPVDAEYNNGALIAENNGTVFDRALTVNGLKLVVAGAVGGQLAVPDEWAKKTARAFELMTDPNGAGINTTHQRNFLKTLKGDAGTKHAGIPTVQRVGYGGGITYTPNWLEDSGAASYAGLQAFNDSVVQKDMVWYKNISGNNPPTQRGDIEEIFEHIFHTIHAFGIPGAVPGSVDAVEMNPDIRIGNEPSFDWKNTALHLAMKEAIDAGLYDPSGYATDWNTDPEAAAVAYTEYTYLVNWSMWDMSVYWDGGSLSPEWDDSLKTPAGMLANNPLGYALFNTYFAPVLSKPNFATIESIFGENDTGVSGYVVDSLGGNIYLMTKDSGFFYIKSYDGDRDLAHFHDNGPVQLYYANSLKLATSDSGVSITGNTRISGNLTVDGTTTSINSSELVVGDKNIVLADSAPDAAAADGGGITLNGANATILYTNSTNTWDFNKAFGTGINVLSNYTTNELTEGTSLYYTRNRWDSALSTVTTTDLTEGSNLYYTTSRADSDFDIRFATKSTTNLTEGNNLYYRRDRFDSALGDDVASSIIYDKFSATGNLNYNNATGVFSFSLGDFTTNDINEGTNNLYYTTARFDSDFGDNTTSDLTEGTNLYYTLARVDSAFDVRLATKTTDDVTEGTNLYYTSARADSDAKNAISVSGDLTYDPNTGIMSIDVEQIYTFNNFDSDFRQRLTTTTTDSIGEGSNLYYTSVRADSDARHSLALNDLGGDGSLTYNSSTGVITYTGPSAAEVRAHFSATGDLSYDSATGIFTVDVSDIYSKAEFDSDLGDANTDQLPEGNTNLYYTTSRADSDAKHALTGGTSIVYSSDTGTISAVQAIDSTDNVSFNTITNKDGTTTNTPAAVVVTDTSPNVLDNFAHNNQPVSFEYLVHLFDSTNSATQITKMIGTYDGTNIASNEFGTVFTGTDYMGELDFDINGNNIRLLYTKEASLGTVRTKAIKTIIS